MFESHWEIFNDKLSADTVAHCMFTVLTGNKRPELKNTMMLFATRRCSRVDNKHSKHETIRELGSPYRPQLFVQ